MDEWKYCPSIFFVFLGSHTSFIQAFYHPLPIIMWNQKTPCARQDGAESVHNPRFPGPLPDDRCHRPPPPSSVPQCGSQGWVCWPLRQCLPTAKTPPKLLLPALPWLTCLLDGFAPPPVLRCHFVRIIAPGVFFPGSCGRRRTYAFL